MLGVEVFETAYHELASRYESLTKDVYLVPADQMRECSDLLGLCQVEYDEKLYFNDESADIEIYGRGDAGGVTINFLLKGKAAAPCSSTKIVFPMELAKISSGCGGTTHCIMS
ncbi:hypothetical protein IMF27_28150 [Pseudomonas sp. PCH199]|uniref:hypothetical protein n=1 Tax=unclassified Pseudomonas TaxID=196821 RepID=UPI000BDC7B8A|nr:MULTISPECIES: hypothetical protein [unclassified Pseudomonas]MCW8278907.1 hypothetical protein [Pseudomonas sp. PCH199]PAM79738.1 hypothetical protein CES87_28795 [Pseudomonas sp. ERMR1:02]